MWTTNDTSWRRTASWRQIPIECHSRHFTDNYIVLVIDNIYWEYESVKPQFMNPCFLYKCNLSIATCWTLSFARILRVQSSSLPFTLPNKSTRLLKLFLARNLKWASNGTPPILPSHLQLQLLQPSLPPNTHPLDPTTPHSQHLRAPHLFLSIQSTQLQLIQLILPHIIRCFLRWRSKRRSIYEIDHYFVMCSFE